MEICPNFLANFDRTDESKEQDGRNNDGMIEVQFDGFFTKRRFFVGKMAID